MATLFCRILEGELGSPQTSLCTIAGGTPLSGNSRTCATCFKSPHQVSVWVQIRQEAHPEDFCNHGGVGRMARAGGMCDKSTSGANPPKLLLFSFKRSLLGSQRSPYWVLTVAHGSPETLPQTTFSFSICLSSLYSS